MESDSLISKCENVGLSEPENPANWLRRAQMAEIQLRMILICLSICPYVMPAKFIVDAFVISNKLELNILDEILEREGQVSRP